MLGCAKLGIDVRIATPKGYECNPMMMQKKTKELEVESGTENLCVTIYWRSLYVLQWWG